MWNISFYYYAINTFYQIIQVLKRITEDNLVYLSKRETENMTATPI